MKKVTLKKLNQLKTLTLIIICLIFFCDGINNYAKNKLINSEVNIQYLSEDVFPALEDVTQNVSSKTEIPEIEDENRKININIANIQDLQILKGIGPSKAAEIINYREEYGLFTCIEEIVEVKGIGEATYKKINEFITID